MRRAPRLLKKDRAYQEILLCMPGLFSRLRYRPHLCFLPLCSRPKKHVRKALCNSLIMNVVKICAKRFFILSRMIFQSPEIDFPFCGKRFSSLLFSGAAQNAVFVPENADDFPCPDVHKAVAPVSSSTLS